VANKDVTDFNVVGDDNVAVDAIFAADDLAGANFKTTITAYWSKIANFFYIPPVFNAPIQRDPIGISPRSKHEKTGLVEPKN